MWNCIFAFVLPCFSFAIDVQYIDGSTTSPPVSVLLVAPPFAGHVIPFLALGEELVQRGHNVTLISAPWDFVEKRMAKSNINLLSIGEGFFSAEKAAEMVTKTANSAIAKMLQILEVSVVFQKDVLRIIDDPNIIKSFDVIAGDAAFSTFLLCFSRKWNIPSINIWVSLLLHPFDIYPWPYPSLGSGYTDDLTFYQRLSLTVIQKVTNLFLNRHLASYLDFSENLCTEASTPLRDSMYFTHYLPQIVTTSIGLEFSRALLPLTDYVGPMISQSQPELPSDVAELLDKRGAKSVVYVSMGSMVKLTVTDAEMIINGATQANLSVIWSVRQSNQDILQNMNYDTDNVLIASWVPQVTVLRHPSIHSAILHGGLGGIQEALSCGIPIITIPFFAEQLDNTIRVQYHNYGVMLNQHELTTGIITQSLKLFDSELYRNSLKKIQGIYKKDGGASRAADLIEFYSQFGYDHLIPAFAKYNWSWIAYNNIDTYTVLILTLVLLSYLVYRLIRSCCSAIFASSKKKTE